MSKKFTENEVMILKEVAYEVDEFYVDDRKGWIQTKYVFKVEEGVTYNDWIKDRMNIPVPADLYGTWMMSHSAYLGDYCLDDCIEDYSWVGCEQVEKVVKVWEEV